MNLEIDYDLDQIAEAVGMSTRWVRDRVRDGAAHQRYGNKIKMTAEQVALLRAAHTKEPDPVVESITTGRRKRSA